MHAYKQSNKNGEHIRNQEWSVLLPRAVSVNGLLSTKYHFYITLYIFSSRQQLLGYITVRDNPNCLVKNGQSKICFDELYNVFC